MSQDKISAYLGLHATALPLREKRMQVIAGNLANADTPHYRARELDFDAALRQAAAQRSGVGVGVVAATATGHLPLAALEAPVIERPVLQPSLDGNTVDPDTERAAFARAALEYRASLSFLESKVRGLLTAITGQ